ncbi:MAG: universal stress protein [Desulfobacteraceae bacterium]|jgi:nucleotide-binding universal stress UspA family protein
MKVSFSRILCTTDLSDYSNQGLSYGITLAQEFDAQLYLCHVTHLPPVVIHDSALFYPSDTLSTIEKEADRKIRALMEGQSVNWQPLILKGPVADKISEVVIEKKIDLAIAATHARTGLRRLFLGSVTESLMRTIPCPLLIVNPSDQSFHKQTSLSPEFRHILVGCDFSSDSDSAVRYGLSLAQEFQAELHLVHVIEPAGYREDSKQDSMDYDLRRHLGKQFIEELQELVPADVRTWCEVRTACLAGRPHEELTKYAILNDIDLIILGIRGHGLMETMLLGSTTDRVIRQGANPVLSVCPMPKH